MRRLNQAGKEWNNIVSFLVLRFVSFVSRYANIAPPPRLKIKLGLKANDILNLCLQLYVLSPAEEILAVMLTVRLSDLFV